MNSQQSQSPTNKLTDILGLEMRVTESQRVIEDWKTSTSSTTKTTYRKQEEKQLFSAEVCKCDENEMRNVLSSQWLVIVTSCLFVSLICWDIVGDEKGWRGAMWVPLSGLGMIVVILLVVKVIAVVVVIVARGRRSVQL
mgnify:CR=1 FL=1